MAGSWSDIAKEMRRAAAIQRVGRNIAWEVVGDPRPLDLSAVPAGTAALTPEYLSAVLAPGHAGARVESITLGKASSGSGNRCAFSVAWNAAGAAAGLPTRLFHKFSQDFYVRLHLLRVNNDRNEHYFYGRIRPELDIETPKPHYTAFDERSRRLSIILDDVTATQGATFFEVGTPLTRADIEGMLAILADLHAAYWNSPRLHAEFDWLMTPVDFCDRLIEGMELRELTTLGFRRAGSVVPAALQQREDEVWAGYLKAMQISAREPLTYIHGDPHLRNFYRTSDARIGLCDWQVTMKGAWSHDFAYTMLTSLPIDKRRAWEKDLLRFYLERVAAKGGRPPAFDAAWDLYRRQTMYTFVGWLVTIGFGALQPSMQPDSESLAIIERAAVAVDDLDTLAMLRD